MDFSLDWISSVIYKQDNPFAHWIDTSDWYVIINWNKHAKQNPTRLHSRGRARVLGMKIIFHSGLLGVRIHFSIE